jgi:NTE family protein
MTGWRDRAWLDSRVVDEGPQPGRYNESVHVNGQHPAQLLKASMERRKAAASYAGLWHRLNHGERERVPTAFILAGGGNRGAYQMGMLRALAERGITADIVIGSSVGAINAAIYAGRPTIEEIHLTSEVWRGLTTDHIFPRDRLHGAWRFLERRESVFANTGLRALLERVVRFDRIEDAELPLVVVATRASDGAEQWFTAGPAVEAILASAALPAVYPSVEVEGVHYRDGGIVNNAPISVALAAGARRIFLMLCSNVRHGFAAGERPFEALLTAFDMALVARLRRDLATIADEAELILLEPVDAPRPEWEDFSNTKALIEVGYTAARDTLDTYSRGLRSDSGTRSGSEDDGRGSGRRKKVSR